MAYTTSSVHIEYDDLAQATLADRRKSSLSKSYGCWGGVRLLTPTQAYQPVAVAGHFPTHFGFSSGVSDTDSLHAERVALEKLAEAVGVGQSFKRATTDGRASGMVLADRVMSIKIYTDLPACSQCRKWLEALSESLVVHHVYCSLFEDYYDQDKNQRLETWRKFMKDYVNTEA